MEPSHEPWADMKQHEKGTVEQHRLVCDHGQVTLSVYKIGIVPDLEGFCEEEMS